jgi:hypothetical protein
LRLVQRKWAWKHVWMGRNTDLHSGQATTTFLPHCCSAERAQSSTGRAGGRCREGASRSPVQPSAGCPICARAHTTWPLPALSDMALCCHLGWWSRRQASGQRTS